MGTKPDDGESDPSPTTTNKGRVGVYIGESSRSLYERALEHVTEGAKFSEKSHIVKHWMEMHQDSNIIPKFRFKVIISHKECL